MTSKPIAIKLANQIGMPFIWEDLEERMVKNIPLPSGVGLFGFYASDLKTQSIIAFGGPAVKPKRYKITYKNGTYTAHRRRSGKFYELGTAPTLVWAQAICYIN